MIEDFYFSKCSHCPGKEKKKHRVYSLSRRFGVKLQCYKCGHIKNNYLKLQNLEPYREVIK